MQKRLMPLLSLAILATAVYCLFTAFAPEASAQAPDPSGYPAPVAPPAATIPAPPAPDPQACCEATKKDLEKAKTDAKKAWDTAAKFRGSAVERQRLNQAVNEAKAKVVSLEAALKKAEGETAKAKEATAEAKADADKAKAAFAHCEGLEATAKEDCLEAEAARQASLSQLQTSREPDAGLILGGITHDGRAAVGGLALGRGWVKYKIRDRDGKGNRVDFEARIDPQYSAPATTTTTELAAAPAPSTSSSWKRYLGACAVGGVGFAGVRGFDYYNSRTPKQVDGDHALSIMGTAAATGCAGGVVLTAVWDGAVYMFSE